MNLKCYFCIKGKSRVVFIVNLPKEILWKNTEEAVNKLEDKQVGTEQTSGLLSNFILFVFGYVSVGEE